MLQRNIDIDEVVHFNINRKNVWDGAVRATRRPNISARLRIYVKFTDAEGNSEGAVDSSAPMREFFRLESPVLTGSDYESVLKGCMRCKCCGGKPSNISCMAGYGYC